MNRGQCLLHTAETSERDRRCEVAAFLQAPEQFEAVHARHDQIRDDGVRVESSEPFQGFLPVCRHLCFKGGLGKHGRQGGTLAFLIVNYEDPARNRRQSRHSVHFSAKPRIGIRLLRGRRRHSDPMTRIQLTASASIWSSTSELLPRSRPFRYLTVMQGFSRFPGESGL